MCCQQSESSRRQSLGCLDYVRDRYGNRYRFTIVKYIEINLSEDIFTCICGGSHEMVILFPLLTLHLKQILPDFFPSCQRLPLVFSTQVRGSSSRSASGLYRAGFVAVTPIHIATVFIKKIIHIIKLHKVNK